MGQRQHFIERRVAHLNRAETEYKMLPAFHAPMLGDGISFSNINVG